MNSPIKKSYALIKIASGTLVLLMGLVITLFVISKVSAVPISSEQGEHLITIHDRGVDSVILTDASTVGEALAKANVTLDDKDAVEPARTESLVASEYDVNIYRARPVMVVDGMIRQTVVTPYQTAEQITQSVGIALFPEDKTVLSRSNDILSGGAGLVLTIDRAVTVNLDLYGKVSPIRTQGETVGEMLAEKSITLSDKDKVSPDASTRITPDMPIRVWREGKQTITASEPIDFGIDIIHDGDRAIGYKEIKTPGITGLRDVTYEITIENGQEIGRQEIASITISKPTNQIEIVGAKQTGTYTTPSENETITWNYLIGQGFSREQTAGIMGNLMQEHHFNTSDTSGGLGIVQWTGGRKAKLLALDNPYSIYTQLNFLMSELNGSYSFVRDLIKATNSIDTAVIIFQDKFEKCGICMEDNRIQYAHNIYVSH